jgi:hypothetical protein
MRQLRPHFVVSPQLFDCSQVPLDDLPPFSKGRNTVTDLVDDVPQHRDACVMRTIPKICTRTTTATSKGVVGRRSPYPTVRMVVVAK